MNVAGTKVVFTALVLAVGVLRLLEMRVSRQRQRALAADAGARPLRERVFPFMVALHTAVLVGAIVEVWSTDRAFRPVLASVALVLVAAANALRLWVIATLGRHWNVRIVSSLSLGVVSGGPYRFVRHPNYVAVFVELLALPLVHGAFVTAFVGAALHALVLRARVRSEDAVLLADAGYRAAMGGKPRFLPWPRRVQP